MTATTTHDAIRTLVVCPCGSGLLEAECCGAYLAGKRQAPSVEVLMRSRYTAYVRQDADYLLRTWHPATRPPELSFGPGDDCQWLGLQVLHTTQGHRDANSGSVEFVARYRHAGRVQRMHELSKFVREAGRWLYVDGKQKRDADPAGRVALNAQCPCGRGKKYKRCCGRDLR